MLHFLLVFAMFQTLPQVLPSPNVRVSVGDGFALFGQLHFEEGAEPGTVDVELRDGVARNILDQVTSNPAGVFRFNDVPLGRYYVVIESEQYQRVQQHLVVGTQTFAMINLDISVYPRRVDVEGETLVSMEELRRNVPREAIDEYDEAVVELQKENSDNAIDHLERALEIAPDFYEAHLQLGLTHQREERRAQAISSLERAAELNEASAEARTWLGRLYFETGEFQRAVAALSERLELGAPSGNDHFYIGSSYYRLGNLAAAEQNLLRAAQTETEESGQARLQLFNVYIRSGQPRKALEQLDAYLEEFPDAPNHDAIKERAEQIRKDLGPGNR